jgi:hypothetical protein
LRGGPDVIIRSGAFLLLYFVFFALRAKKRNTDTTDKYHAAAGKMRVAERQRERMVSARRMPF